MMGKTAIEERVERPAFSLAPNCFLAALALSPRPYKRLYPEVEKEQTERDRDCNLTHGCGSSNITMVFADSGASADNRQHQKQKTCHFQPQRAKYMSNARQKRAAAAVQAAGPAIFAGFPSSYAQCRPALPSPAG